MNGDLPVSKNTFIHADDKTYRELEWDMLNHIYQGVGSCQDECKPRIAKLEKRRKFDTTVAAFFGLVGGAMVHVAKWIIRP